MIEKLSVNGSNMGALIADIFSGEKNIDSFRGRIISLNGEFSFDSASMIDLGRVYFNRYPDRFSNRNMEEVQTGYSIVRICIIEKVIKDLPQEKKDIYRRIFNDISIIVPLVRSLAESSGIDAAKKDFDVISSSLQRIKDTIDEIPKGMIKERFIGGISNLFNVLYVLRINIDNYSC